MELDVDYDPAGLELLPAEQGLADCDGPGCGTRYTCCTTSFFTANQGQFASLDAAG